MITRETTRRSLNQDDNNENDENENDANDSVVRNSYQLGASTEKLSSLMSYLDDMESGGGGGGGGGGGNGSIGDGVSFAAALSPSRSFASSSTTSPSKQRKMKAQQHSSSPSVRSMVREGRRELGVQEKLVRDSVAPGKKWVWDDFDGLDDEGSGRSRTVGGGRGDISVASSKYLDILSGEKSLVARNDASELHLDDDGDNEDDDDEDDFADGGPLSSLTRNTSSAHHDEIKKKINAMRGELEEKRQEVRVRAPTRNEIVCEKK